METGIQKYLDGALAILKRHQIEVVVEESQLVRILDDVKQVDEPKIIAIADVVRYAGSFDQMIMDKIEGVSFSDRYNKVIEKISSLRDDAQKIFGFLKDGKVTLEEKIRSKLMNLMRGTPQERLKDAKKVYLSVANDAKTQIDRETDILEGYKGYRFALKSAEGLTQEVLKEQELIRKNAETAFLGAAEKVKQAEADSSGKDASEKSRLQLERDIAEENYKKEDRNYQLLLNVANNLNTGYFAQDTVMTKIRQIRDSKDAVHMQMVTFFDTNKTVLTSFVAAYVFMMGLHEATRTTQAMQEELSKSLEFLGEIGGKVDEEAMRVAYGPSYKLECFKKFIESVTTLEEQRYQLIDKLRKETEEFVTEARKIYEDGKERRSKAVENYLSGQTPSTPPAQLPA